MLSEVKEEDKIVGMNPQCCLQGTKNVVVYLFALHNTCNSKLVRFKNIALWIWRGEAGTVG